MDIWSKDKRSQVMSLIRGQNTKPEVIIRKILYKRGYRYRLNYSKLPGKPDIVFPKYKIVIFIHGCFWHGHENCKIAHIPKTNTKYWSDKFTKNKERDNNVSLSLINMGWQVLIIWECEITKTNIQNVINKIEHHILCSTSRYTEKKLRVRIYEEIDNQICNVAEDIIPYEK